MRLISRTRPHTHIEMSTDISMGSSEITHNFNDQHSETDDSCPSRRWFILRAGVKYVLYLHLKTHEKKYLYIWLAYLGVFGKYFSNTFSFLHFKRKQIDNQQKFLLWYSAGLILMLCHVLGVFLSFMMQISLRTFREPVFSIQRMKDVVLPV